MGEVWTVRDILAWCTTFLKQASTTPRLDSELLLCHALDCNRVYLYCHGEKPLTTAERGVIKKNLLRRAQGEPIAYILGVREFYGYDFKVNSHVLIPRPETEHLVEEILNDLKRQQGPYKGLDIGTGSGCIPIVVSKENPQGTMTAWDICPQALAVAAENAETHGVTIQWAQQDALLIKVWQELADSSYDFICSNPPYIANTEWDDVALSVKNFEPHKALFAEQDGLVFYQVLARQAKRVLKPAGALFVEMGSQQRDAVIAILEEQGWGSIKVVKDLAKLPRVVVARR